MSIAGPVALSWEYTISNGVPAEILGAFEKKAALTSCQLELKLSRSSIPDRAVMDPLGAS